MTGIIIAVMSCTAAARSLTKSEIASVESVIKKNLDNPASARFFTVILLMSAMVIYIAFRSVKKCTRTIWREKTVFCSPAAG